MANCTNCGSELAEGARICQVCGSPVAPQQPPQQGWQPAPPPPPGQGQPEQGPPGAGYGPPPAGGYGQGQQGQAQAQPGYGYGQAQQGQGGYQYGYGPPQAFPGGPMGVPRTDGQAIAALVCGIIGIVACPVIFSVIAIVLGKQSERRVKESGGTLTGDQMAKAGWILGIIGLVLSVLMLIVFALVASTAMMGF